MTKPLKSHIFISSNLLSTAVNGAHVKMADLWRWAMTTMGSIHVPMIIVKLFPLVIA